jgi:hypothetical protein
MAPKVNGCLLVKRQRNSEARLGLKLAEAIGGVHRQQEREKKIITRSAKTLRE